MALENAGEDHVAFFFSSRGRHTSCYRDWSSDVCSSDLTPSSAASATTVSSPPGGHWLIGVRSEERRVGKECRCRRPPRPHKTKPRLRRRRCRLLLPQPAPHCPQPAPCSPPVSPSSLVGR